jgi:APA family basic amino acid/polyamine antiporter
MATLKASPQAVAEDKPTLLAQLGLISCCAIVISNMMGTGILTSSGFQAGDLGDPKILLLIWVVGAVCALAGAFCYSELGVNFPSSGGEYVYLSRAFGLTWGFLSGWISLVAGFSAPIAATSLALSEYLTFFVPALAAKPWLTLGSGPLSLQIGPPQALAVLVIGLLTVLNILGVKNSGRVQMVLTATKIAVFSVFIVLAFTMGHGDWGNFSQTTERFNPSVPVGQQFFVSLLWIYVAYSGWNAATYVAEEIKQPGRTLPLALAIGTAVVAVFYVLLNVVFVYSMPMGVMKGKLQVFTLSAERMFGHQAAGIFSAFVALALLASINAMVTIGPRVYYAMARQGAFLAAAAKIHPKYRTPVFAILAQSILAILMSMTPFRDLMTYIGFTLNFFATMAVASLFFLRGRPGWQKLPVVSFAYPLVPAFFVVVGLWMTYQGLTKEPKVSFAGIATVLVGALVYHFRMRSNNTSIPAAS